MTYVRKFEHTDHAGDTLYASWAVQTGEGWENANEHIAIRTKGGTPVYLPMRVARELAGWLIEHAIDVPTEELTIADEVRARAAASPVAVSTGQLGGYGGQGGAGGSATIVQRSV